MNKFLALQLNRLLNTRGVSLIELLLVLALLSIVLVLILPVYPSVSTHLDYQFIVQQFEEDFLFAQQLAIAESRFMEFTFVPSLKFYKVEDYLTKERIISRQLPEAFAIRTNFDQYSFRILRSGYISRGGSVWFDYELNGKKKTKKFIFQLATGRVRLEEL